MSQKKRSGTKRNGVYYLYIPQKEAGVVLRSTGTRAKHVYSGMKRMVATLKDHRRWAVLAAIIDGRLTLGQTYDAYTAGTLDTLEATLSASKLSAYTEPYLASLLGKGKDAKYVESVGRHIEAFIATGAVSTVDLNPETFDAWIAGLTCSPGTRRQHFYSMTGFARYLRRVPRVLKVFPFDGMTAPDKNGAKMRYESEKNDKRIVDAVSPKYRAMLAFIKGTGCDASTPLRTLRRHLDLERGIAEIQGRKTDTRLVHEGLIESWALPYLRDYCADKLPHAELWPEGHGAPGKHGRAETPYFTTDGLGKAHVSACKALKIDGYTVKDARHSVAVRMARKGYSPFEIAEQIGSSAYLVSKVYARFLVKLERRVSPDDTPTADSTKVAP